MNPWVQILGEELERSVAVISGKRVACLLETEFGTYLSHNGEIAEPRSFVHAEMAALDAVVAHERDPCITRIVMAGAGRARRLKHIIPCFDCFESLRPYTSSESRIILLVPGSLDAQRSCSVEDLVRAYEAERYSSLRGVSYQDIVTELNERTLLEGTDTVFASTLRVDGLKRGISFFLTGSSSGRGGAARALLEMGEWYDDIDIIGVAPRDCWDEVFAMVEGLIAEHYGGVRSCDAGRA